MRYCDIFVLVFIVLPVIWLYFIDIEKAKKQALAAAKFEAKELGIIQMRDDQSSWITHIMYIYVGLLIHKDDVFFFYEIWIKKEKNLGAEDLWQFPCNIYSTTTIIVLGKESIIMLFTWKRIVLMEWCSNIKIYVVTVIRNDIRWELGCYKGVEWAIMSNGDMLLVAFLITSTECRWNTIGIDCLWNRSSRWMYASFGYRASRKGGGTRHMNGGAKHLGYILL